MNMHELMDCILPYPLTESFDKTPGGEGGVMPEGARILMGDTRQWESPTILCGCLRRYSGIHKPRHLGILGRMSLFPFRSALVLSYQKTVPELLSVLPVRYNKWLLDRDRFLDITVLFLPIDPFYYVCYLCVPCVLRTTGARVGRKCAAPHTDIYERPTRGQPNSHSGLLLCSHTRKPYPSFLVYFLCAITSQPGLARAQDPLRGK
jgi:hypothetical protein